MASQTQGIQQLLAAEKRAAEKVSDARKRECIRQRVVLNVSRKNIRDTGTMHDSSLCDRELCNLLVIIFFEIDMIHGEIF